MDHIARLPDRRRAAGKEPPQPPHRLAALPEGRRGNPGHEQRELPVESGEVFEGRRKLLRPRGTERIFEPRRPRLRRDTRGAVKKREKVICAVIRREEITAEVVEAQRKRRVAHIRRDGGAH